MGHDLPKLAPRRARRFIIVAAVLVAAVGTAVYTRTSCQQRSLGNDCEQLESLDGTWNEARAQAVRASFSASGVEAAGSAADRAIPWLDRWSEAHDAAQRDACGQWAGGSHNHGLWTRAQDCFSEQREVFDALLEELEQADALAVHEAVSAAAALPGPRQCASEQRLGTGAPLPADDLESARNLVATLSAVEAKLLVGHLEQALELALRAHDEAEALEHPRLLAWAKLCLGTAQARLDLVGQAEASLTQAVDIAGSDVAPAIGVRAARELSSLTGDRLKRPEVGAMWDRMANLIAREHGLDTAVDSISAANHMAGVYMGLGKPEQGVSRFASVLPEAEAKLGPNHPLVARALNLYGNLVASLGDLERARAILGRAITVGSEVHGPLHPSVAAATMDLGSVEQTAGDLERASEHFARSIEIRTAAFGEDSPVLISSLLELGAIETDAGDPQRATGHIERALEIATTHHGDSSPRRADCLEALAHAHLALGKIERAEDGFKQVIVLREQLVGEQDASLGFALTGLARVAMARGEPASGRFAAERAVTVLADSPGDEELLGRAYFTLAQALWAESDQPGPARARALVAAAKAKAALRESGALGHEEIVTAWLEAHGG